MGELVAALLLWIGAHTGYRVDGIPRPEVRLVSAREITAEYYAEAQLSAYGRPEVDERIWALYDMEGGTGGIVYVVNDRPLDDPLFQERLLHELVHHVQRVNGAYGRFRCRAEGEREAYLLGGRFLKEKRAEDPLPNRNFWAAMYSRC
ncbi:DUF6647 family protein [Azospirillum sp. TSO22-1]|uniref:DUF6647 family protein n=1 Tax=Azospirillum sp. TSO22-1 TaxID=716789 RepID=UPI000D61981A|nr:DUF6647 family protein [Azospirillum sp. TSO22-1]PWC56014.1 hypothetical protein TSO221_02900 [Azospirillum sp. TSO22-1]